MKKGLGWLLMALLVAGCAHRYDMILTNGVRITNVSKPILNKESSQFTYKDVAGNQHQVSEGRVLSIQPHSHRQNSTTPSGP